MQELNGKLAFVTGSSRGIGRAAALELAAAGCTLIFHGTAPSAALDSAAAEAGENSIKLTADFSDLQAVELLAEKLSREDKVPDILVLNASVQSYTGLGNFDAAEYLRMFNTNVESACILLHRLLPEMRKKMWGRVIFVGSVNGTKPASRLALYGSTKAALMNIAQTAAVENAPFNITVNTILPGVIETDRNAKALSDPEFAAMLKEKIPMHRFGSAGECADLVAFLASPRASYITGAEIPIAGGLQL